MSGSVINPFVPCRADADSIKCPAAFWFRGHWKDLCSLPGGPESVQHIQCCPTTDLAEPSPYSACREALHSAVCDPPLYTSCYPSVTLAQHQSKPATACREAVDSGEYAAAFWLCAQCCKSMEDLQRLKVSQQLDHTINKLYEDTLSRLEGALQVACADFQAESYQKASGTATEWSGG